jgi:hypothetical protein
MDRYLPEGSAPSERRSSRGARADRFGGDWERDERDAIIFLPGMGDQWVSQSIQTIGRKIADGLDDRSTPSAEFQIEVRDEVYGNDAVTSACTITRKDGDDEVPMIDIYRLDSVRTLRKGWEEHSLLVKACLPLVLLVSSLYLAVKRIGEPKGKRARNRYQFFYALWVLGLLSFYVALVLFTIVTTAFPDTVSDVAQAVPSGVVAVLTALGLWQSKHVTTMATGAVGYMTVMSYFRYGHRREDLVGSLARLLQHLAENKKVAYRHIDLCAYSFGSVVALDALFPPKGRESKILDSVRTLVTIGCPCDLVRTYWPSYFHGRDVWVSRPGEWLNIYMPLDVLSSNCQDKNDESPHATLGIPTDVKPGEGTVRRPTNLLYDEPTGRDKLGPISFLMVMGLRSHSFYWGTESTPDLGVFPEVVERLYGGEPVLR